MVLLQKSVNMEVFIDLMKENAFLEENNKILKSDKKVMNGVY